MGKTPLISAAVHVLVLCGMPHVARERAEEGKGQAGIWDWEELILKQ